MQNLQCQCDDIESSGDLTTKIFSNSDLTRLGIESGGKQKVIFKKILNLLSDTKKKIADGSLPRQNDTSMLQRLRSKSNINLTKAASQATAGMSTPASIKSATPREFMDPNHPHSSPIPSDPNDETNVKK